MILSPQELYKAKYERLLSYAREIAEDYTRQMLRSNPSPEGYKVSASYAPHFTEEEHNRVKNLLEYWFKEAGWEFSQSGGIFGYVLKG